ncbi:MAG: SusD/RagB family nutrient-binding outer membrane lipoprotein [Bacteroidales bacterium]|nr:SusD/RagB family nutrient-binding outer membrane lipoprotein [Bacteroidales bacterium]
MKRYNMIPTAAIIAFTMLASGCSEDILDDINKDKSHPDDAPAKSVVSELITNTAFTTVGGDYSLYASIYIEQEAGVHNQMFNAETRNGEPVSSTTYNNVWNSTYTNMKNAKLVIAKCTEEGGLDIGNEITLGVAKLLLAYNAAVQTDLFGDVPFTEAGEINPNGTPKYMQPKIDKQENIYKDVMRLLNEAIVHFDGSDDGLNGPLGANDYIYGGDKKLWKKAAYGLKARYTMRLLGRSANPNADLLDIIDYVDMSFADADEELKFDLYDGEATLNPLFGFSYSRDGLGASASLLDKFVRLNDPRASQYFATWVTWVAGKMITDPDEVFTAPNGTPEQGQKYYDFALVNYSLTAPTQLLSYHEIQFLKAEALTRLNRELEAKPILQEALTAAFANQEVAIASALYEWGFGGDVDLGAETAEQYFTDEVEARFDTHPLQEIIIQKYLAFAGASGESVEAYNDYRRLAYLGDDFIELANPKNVTQFPLRFSYGVDEVTNNVAVKEAYGNGQYVYSEPVWWAGGTR